MMLSKAVSILLLGLFVSASGHTISSTCVDVCKSESSITCSSPCELDPAVLSALRSSYGRDVVDGCVTPCRCDEHEHVYAGDKVCEVVQSFALANAGQGCECHSGASVWAANLNKWNIQEPAQFARGEVIDYLLKRENVQHTSNRLRPRMDSATTNPWERWCQLQCYQGTGGSACYCDILP